MTTPAGKNFFFEIKTAIVKALKAALDDVNYPDPEIQGVEISMNYPMEENSYPHLWVEFSFTKFQQAGIGHSTMEDGYVVQEWYFEGNVRLNIVALRQVERDIYSSQLLQLLAFRSLSPIGAKFDEFLKNGTEVHLTINKDTLAPLGQRTDIGTPWKEDQVYHEDGYSFDVIGQIESNFRTTPEFLREINITAGTKVDGDTRETIYKFNGENKITPGEWF